MQAEADPLPNFEVWFPLVALRKPRQQHLKIAQQPDDICQGALEELGFRPDCWMPFSIARQWRSVAYPLHAEPESVKQWLRFLEVAEVTFARWKIEESRRLADRIAEDQAHDLELIRQFNQALASCRHVTPQLSTGETHLDGPEPPHWLWWKGQKHKIGQGRATLSFRLLEFFWNRDSATYQGLQGPNKPWPDPIGESGIATAVNRFNNDIPSDLPWKLSTKGRCVHKEFRENPIK